MDYNKMKKEELIKVLKEKDAAVAGFQETNKLLVKEKVDLVCERDKLQASLNAMTEECTALNNKINGLKDDVELANLSVKNLTNENNNLKSEVNSCKLDLTIKDAEIHSSKHRYRIITVILIVAVIIAVIF